MRKSTYPAHHELESTHIIDSITIIDHINSITIIILILANISNVVDDFIIFTILTRSECVTYKGESLPQQQ